MKLSQLGATASAATGWKDWAGGSRTAATILTQIGRTSRLRKSLRVRRQSGGVASYCGGGAETRTPDTADMSRVL